MQFKIARSVLLRAVGLAHNVADKKSTLPLLASICLRSLGKDRLLVLATDLHVSFSMTCPAEIKEEGAVVIDAKRFYDAINNLPDLPNSPIEIQSDAEGAQVKIHCGRSRYI